MVDTDKDWETFAKKDAYYSVLTRPEFAKARENPEAKTRFFESGEEHVSEVLERLGDFSAPGHSSWDVLDFGCGVGRVLIPFAGRCRSAVGVDVSQSMIEEARRNIADAGRSNAIACRLDEIPEGQQFDLIHSTIVFQHIPVSRGVELTKQLLALLKPGGMIALHYTFARTYPHPRLGWKLASRFPWLIPIFRALRLENPFKKRMLMMRYDLNELFELLHVQRVGRLAVDIVDDHGNLGVMIYGQV